MALRWYVVHAYSNFENKVKQALEDRIKREGLEQYFGKILVPTEEIVEMRMGQQRKSERKFFPGYVLVQMELTDETWHLVKDVPRVLGFIGGTSDRPAPISEKEAMSILNKWKKVLISLARKFYLRQVKSLESLMDHLRILMVWSRKLITKKTN
jgi:transcriptional antiterminator NusG